FVNGGDWENPDANCGTVANNNRVETITSSGQNIYNVFNGCNYTLSLKENLLDNVDVTYTREQGLIINSQKSYNKLYVSIYDLSGRKINYTILSNTSNIQNTILVNSISKGLYIVNINDENNRKLTKKVLFH
ncbi:MAG: T9SS type A sorting domain-containing protein, partial [Polaribacter sp.]